MTTFGEETTEEYRTLHDDEKVRLKDDIETPNTGEEVISLDDIFNKIGFGMYHLRLISILGFVAVGEGAQIITVPIALLVQQHEWGFSDDVQSFVISLNFLGFILGGVIAGLFADRFGRLKPMLFAIALASVLNLVSAFVSSVGIYTFIRFFVGIFLGFIAPLGFTMVVENMPKAHRGKLVMIATSFLFVGQLLGCFAAWIFLDNLTKGNWVAMVYCTTLLHVFALVINLLFLDESIRYNIVMGNFQVSFRLIEKMMKFNKVPTGDQLTEKEKQGLIKWQENLSAEITDNEIANVSSLFKPEYKKTTLIVWWGYFVNSFVYFGASLFLPRILQVINERENPNQGPNSGTSEDLGGMTISVAVESLSVVIAIFLVDIKSISRKMMLVGFYVITAIVSVASAIYINREMFFIWVTIVKIFSDICSYYFYLYTIEIYPTKYRTTGIGIAGAVGKLATVAMPWACTFLMRIFLFGPFGLFAVLSLLAALATIGLPKDTSNSDLK